MPESGQYISCIVYGNDIVLTGYGVSVYKYDVIMNSYTQVFNLKGNKNKIILAIGAKVYVIESYGDVYESVDGNLAV